MPIDPNVFGARDFDPEAARQASLAATLSRVRLCRKVRHCAGAATALLAVAAAAWLALPATDPVPDPHIAGNPLIIRSAPLAAAQRLVSTPGPELVIRTTAPPAASVRIRTPPDAAVARLGNEEFHTWLAAHQLCCIQLAGGPAQVLSLRAP